MSIKMISLFNTCMPKYDVMTSSRMQASKGTSKNCKVDIMM
jgi:hypothetical protein